MSAEAESTIILSKSRASNLIVLVESEIQHDIFDNKVDLKYNFVEIIFFGNYILFCGFFFKLYFIL